MLDPYDENGWDTMYGPFDDELEPLSDAEVDAIFDEDTQLSRAEDLGHDATQAFYPEWDGPVLIDPDFLPDYDDTIEF